MSAYDGKTAVPFNLTLFIPLSCEYFGSSVSSVGLFQNDDPLEHMVPVLLLQLGTAILMKTILQRILRPFHQPRFVAEMLTGILLGPSILQHFVTGGLYANMFSFKQTKLMGLLEFFSFGVYGYVIGVRTDISMIKSSGKVSWIVGFSVFAFPITIAYSVSMLLEKFLAVEAKELAGICPLVASSSFHVISVLLEDLNLLNSQIGRLALSSSLITSLCSMVWIICSNFYLFATWLGLTVEEYVERQICRFVLILFVIIVLRPLMFWLIRKVPEGKSIEEWQFVTMIVMLFGIGIVSESFGYTAFFGMMILGLAVPTGPPLGSSIIQRLSLFVSAVLLPSYIINAGHDVDVFTINSDDYTLASVIIPLTAYLGKLVGSVVPMRLWGVPNSDSFTLGFIVSSQGFFDISIFKRALSYRQLPQKSYSIIVIMAVLIAAITTPMIVHLYNPSKRYINYKRRTIQHSRDEHELRILVCLHEEDNVFSIMNLLKASYPRKKNPIEAFVLDLIQLVARNDPLLINHQFHKDRSSMLTRTDRIITAFHQFEMHHEGIKHYHFTTIAPYASMHDDICLLALEKTVSLLIIPFHNSESVAVRGVKKNVLDKAPCSVGILVDKKIVTYWGSDFHEEHKFNVCVIFLGGPDSREALALGMHMVENPAIRLTVIRLIAEDDFITDLLETKLDIRAITQLRSQYDDNECINYSEVNVKDGANTVEMLHSLDNQYDLLLVGRRHDNESPLVAGLTDWSFIPELGIIGDVLASSDMKCSASVLVLQQQSTVEDLLKI